MNKMDVSEIAEHRKDSFGALLFLID